MQNKSKCPEEQKNRSGAVRNENRETGVRKTERRICREWRYERGCRHLRSQLVEGYCTIIMSWRGKTHLSPACLINCEASAVTVTGRFAPLEVERQAECHDKKVEKGKILDFLMPSVDFRERDRDRESRGWRKQAVFLWGCLQHSDGSSDGCTQANFEPA